MSLARFSLSIVLLLVSSLATVSAQVENDSIDITVKVDAPKSVSQGEQFRVYYVLKCGREVKIDDFALSGDFKGFTLMKEPSTSTNFSNITISGVQTTEYTIYKSYHLQADKYGKYTLPEATFTVGDKKYKSTKQKIEVTKADNKKQDKSDKAKKDIKKKVKVEKVDAFVKTILSKTTVSPSDTLTLTYRLYTTYKPDKMKWASIPSMSDFYSSEIRLTEQEYTTEKIKGKTYNVFDLRKYILQPRGEGSKTITQGEITLLFETPTGRKISNFWGETYDEMDTEEKPVNLDPASVFSIQMKKI